MDQYKLSDDLEILELDYENNLQLQKTCNYKQPFVFELKSICNTFFENVTLSELLQTKDIDIRLKDNKEYFKENAKSIDYLLLPAQSCYKIIETDSKSHYYSENNESVINETKIINNFKELDKYLKPYYTIQSQYDFMFGSKNCYTPIRYYTNYRTFLSVNTGQMSVKMTPYKSIKFLNCINDYENYEFRSQMNVWEPETMSEYDKLRFIEFELIEGNVLYIPSYWWFSIRFDSCDTCVTKIVYNTPMNIISNSQHLTLYYLQQLNIQSKPLKIKHTVDENAREPIENTTNELHTTPNKEEQ